MSNKPRLTVNTTIWVDMILSRDAFLLLACFVGNNTISYRINLRTFPKQTSNKKYIRSEVRKLAHSELRSELFKAALFIRFRTFPNFAYPHLSELFLFAPELFRTSETTTKPLTIVNLKSILYRVIVT